VREYADAATGVCNWFLLPVVGETWDGFMNDISAMVVRPEDAVKGIEEAQGGRVREGNVGGGGRGCAVWGGRGGRGVVRAW